MPEKTRVPDEFQQLKGTIGLEIAKLYLKEIRGFQIVGEEMKVKGFK